MARIFITGSSLGLAAGQVLIAEGLEVALHGRDRARAEAATIAAPGAVGAISGDVSSLVGMHAVTEQAVGRRA